MKNRDVVDCGPTINVNVVHGPVQYDVSVPAQSTFGDLKKVLSQKNNLKPNEQRLLFRGKEKDDDDPLAVAGMKNNSKVVLLEDSTSKENDADTAEMSKPSDDVDKIAELASALEVNASDGTRVVAEMESAPSAEISKAYEAIAMVRSEVDKLEERVSALEVTVGCGTQVSEKKFDMSTELLMRQLLNLDGIEVEGEAKLQRKAEVLRVQKLVDSLDGLKARNSNPFNAAASNSVTVTTQWETFDSGSEALNSQSPMQPSPHVSPDWERFD